MPLLCPRMSPPRLVSVALAATLSAAAFAVTAEAGERSGPDAPPVVLVEAESFADLGGWVVDQQAMDQMGSPFVMAHGLGVPVRDATTTVRFAASGKYRVWVRTRDWVASWNVAGAPGKFQLLVQGQPLGTAFGTEGAAWHWQDGGTVEITQREVRLALHDLTGFNGRCDAIAFCASPSDAPPNADPPMAEFRRKALGLPPTPPDAGQFDLVVVGGGMAGTCAAISAARHGVQVALVQNRPLLGGNNSSEVRVGLSGRIQLPPYPALGNLVQEIGPIGYYDFLEAKKYPDRPASQAVLQLDPVKAVHNAGPASNYEDAKKLRAVQAEKHIRLFLNMHAYAVQREGSRIRAVLARDTRTGRELRFPAALFADCTGDGAVGAAAGAEWRIGRESRAETGESLAPEQPDRLIMGTSVQWYAAAEAAPTAFPDCSPWAVAFDDQTCQPVTKGDWDWETGMNRDPLTGFEQIRDYALRVVFGNWSFLKNHAKAKAKYAQRRLEWVAYVGGKRESRRLLGDVVLCQQDIQQRRSFPDACVTSTWTIDLHYPAPDNTRHFPGEEFRTVAKHAAIQPYAIPYRCLYSRTLDNLMMAGRDISVTHVALGTVRVQKTTGMMGEVVGMAAAICRKHHCSPRDVYAQHLEELKAMMTRGVPRHN